MAGTRETFELVGHLAAGGMAELFLARPRGAAPTEPCVVLKRILADHARNPSFVTMFLDEARLAARLHHPNIAAVTDVGRTGATYFYTLEYVHGQNARDVLQAAARADVRIPTGVAIAIVCGAAAGLHAAHEARARDGRPLEIVHRDVSPSNVMVGYDGIIKVVDFGVAKAADRMTETRSGTVKGKISYLSPEQALLGDLDRRSDVFSLGIVAWELLTQRRLFKRGSDYEAMRAIIEEPIPAPSQAEPSVPVELDAVIGQALTRTRERRFASAAALAAALTATATRLGLATDAAAVAGFMRELFGSPPLPWLTTDHDVTDSGVMRLEAIDVIEVTHDDTPAPLAPAMAAAVAVTARMRPLAVAPVAFAPSSAVVAAAVAPAVVVPAAVIASPPVAPVAPVAPPPVIAPVAPPPVAPPPPRSAGAEGPAGAGAPSVSGALLSPRPPPRPSDGTASVATAWALPNPAPTARRTRIVPFVVAAAAVAAGVIAAVVIGSSGGADPPALAAAPTPVERPAAAPVAIDAGTAALPAVAPVAIDAGTAALPAVAVDADPPDPPDALDAVADDIVVDDAPARDPVIAAIAAAAADKRWADVAARCGQALDGLRDASTLSRCGQAFCATQQPTLARRVQRRVSSRRRATIERQCLASKAFASAEECKHDPMACP